MEEKMVVGS
jgi:chromosome segregation ATPase